MAQEWQKGIVTKILDETHSTKRYWIQIPQVDNFDFTPGQFITLDLPIHEQKNKRWRSYSIASAPDGTNTIELVIVLNEFGLGTPYLFKEISVGSELTLRGPQGKFTMPDTIDKDLYLICTGTGIAPFRAMAHYINSAKLPHQQVHIIFGCRKFEDGLYINELKNLEKELVGFHFHPCYSREENITEGQYKGYVHDVYEQLLNAAKSADGTMPEAYFYLCGWKNMIDSAKEKIIALGYDKKAIHLELYG